MSEEAKEKLRFVLVWLAFVAGSWLMLKAETVFR